MAIKIGVFEDRVIIMGGMACGKRDRCDGDEK